VSFVTIAFDGLLLQSSSQQCHWISDFEKLSTKNQTTSWNYILLHVFVFVFYFMKVRALSKSISLKSNVGIHFSNHVHSG
jgi:hypothetical protein